MNKLALSLIAVLGLAATQAQAGPKYRYHADDRYDEDRYERNRYDNYERYGAEYAEVVSAQPIYRSVRIEQPRRECWDEPVTYDAGPRYGRGNNAAAGALLGAIVGGVTGHQIGSGHGRDAATAIGAVIGAGVGQQIATQNDRRYGDRVEQVGYEEVCKTVVENRVEQRVEAYDVAYRYAGRVYHTTLPYDPGARIRVDVNVRPVDF